MPPLPIRLLPLLLAAVTACRFEVSRTLPPGDLRGAVQGEQTGTGTRTPLAAARARLVGTPYATQTGENGAFVLRNVPSGDHTLQLSFDGNGDGRNEVLLRLPNLSMAPTGRTDNPRGARDLGNVLLLPAGSLRGRVVFDGGGVDGVSIGIRGQPGLHARTNSDGWFQFSWLAPGTYELFVVAPSEATLVAATLGGPIDVESGQLKQIGEIELPPGTPGGQLQGRLVFDDAIRNSPYSALDLAVLGEGLPDGRRQVTVGDDGSWSVDVPVGFYALRIGAAESVAEFTVGGLAAYPGAEVPPIFVFDASTPFDYDADGLVGEADDDSDGDGALDEEEPASCRFDPDAHSDLDGDELCDSVDADADGDGVPNGFDNCAYTLPADPSQADGDDDGVGDGCDNCPAVANPDQADGDADGRGDACAEGGIDPCAEVDVCGPNADCTPTQGGVVCTCRDGFFGDGQSCRARGWATLDQAPAPRAFPGIALDQAARRLYRFGGGGDSNLGPSGPRANDLWTVDLSAAVPAWAPLESSDAPASGTEPRLFVDAARDRLLALVVGQERVATFSRPLQGTGAWTELPASLFDTGGPWFGRTHLAVFDEANGLLKLVNFQSGAAWTLDVTAPDGQWAALELNATGFSPGLVRARGAYDPANQRVVIQGGEREGFPVNDAWVLDFAQPVPTWRTLETPVDLPAAVDGAAVYDAAGSRVLFHGGVDGSGTRQGATWALAGDIWTSLGGDAGAGAARVGHALELDEGRLLAIGGDAGSPGNEIVALDLAATTPAWAEVVPAVPVLPPRTGHAAVYVPASSAAANDAGLLVFGGLDQRHAPLDDTWFLHLATGVWKRIQPATASPPARAHHAMVYVPEERAVLVYGGYAQGVQGPSIVFGDVWRLRLTGTPDWESITASGGGPAARSSPVAMWRAEAQQLVVWGGTVANVDGVLEPSPDQGVYALELTGAEGLWSKVSPVAAPMTYAFGVASTPLPGRDGIAVYFSGQSENSLFSLDFLAPAGGAWSGVAGAPFGSRFGARLAFDEVRDRLLIFGGFDGAGQSGDLDEIQAVPMAGGGTAVRLCASGPSGARRSSSVVVATPDALVVVGGQDALPTQLVELDLTECATGD